MRDKKILLVEDDCALAMGTEYALQAEDYQVIHAGNLEEARKALNCQLDLILLDVMLPDGNGYDFCSELRKKDREPKVYSFGAATTFISGSFGC